MIMITYWNLFWAMFTLVPLVVFAVGEAVAIRTNAPTYTDAIQRWLGIRPYHPRRRIAVMAFVVGYSAFSVWFVPHIMGYW